MKALYSVLYEMANDRRISDKNFRSAVKELFGEDRRSDSFTDLIRGLAQQAIYETERDKYVK